MSVCQVLSSVYCDSNPPPPYTHTGIVVHLVDDEPPDSDSADEALASSTGSLVGVPLSPSTRPMCRLTVAAALTPPAPHQKTLSQSSKEGMCEQARLTVPSFNEGRRASDTSLSAGAVTQMRLCTLSTLFSLFA